MEEQYPPRTAKAEDWSSCLHWLKRNTDAYQAIYPTILKNVYQSADKYIFSSGEKHTILKINYILAAEMQISAAEMAILAAKIYIPAVETKLNYEVNISFSVQKLSYERICTIFPTVSSHWHLIYS